MSDVLTALIAIQGELKAPKDQNAGRYRYRNIEDINESVKPLAARHGCAVVYTDRFADGICVSTCRLLGKDGELSADGCAYVELAPKNMSKEQASGAASSYARKYAACGLFAIDSSENDPDAHPVQPKKDEVNERIGKAKSRLWAAINRYAELRGIDPNKVLKEAQQREDWCETSAYFNQLAEEFESEA